MQEKRQNDQREQTAEEPSSGNQSIDGDETWRWPYIVMHKMKGEALDSVWNQLRPEDLKKLSVKLSELVHCVHHIPIRFNSPFTEGPTEFSCLDERLPDTWDGFVHFIKRQRRNCVKQHRLWGTLSSRMINMLDSYLPAEDKIEDLLSTYFWTSADLQKDRGRGVWLHSDLTGSNCLMTKKQSLREGESEPKGLLRSEAYDEGSWEIAGLIDFGDSKVGHWVYDLITAHVLILHCSDDLLHSFLQSYSNCQKLLGYHLSLDDEWGLNGNNKGLFTFSYLCMSLTLLHEYDVMHMVFRNNPETKKATTWKQMQQLLWPVQPPF